MEIVVVRAVNGCQMKNFDNLKNSALDGRNMRILLICPLHSSPGSFISATTKPGPGKSVIAICPECIEQGKKIREEMEHEEEKW